MTLQLTGASGATVGTPSTATLEIVDNELIDGLINPIDDPRNFAAQHYHDFLNRDAIGSNDQAGLGLLDERNRSLWLQCRLPR